MTPFYQKVKERYQHFYKLQQEAEVPYKCIMTSMLRLMLSRMGDYSDRFLIETFRDMTYCHLMKGLYTPNEWIRWKSEVEYLIQYLDPSQ